MKKEFVFKKFIKYINERARKLMFSCSLSNVEFIKINLNCILVIVKTSNYSTNYEEIFKMDLKNKKIENCTVAHGSFINTENRKYFFKIIGFKKEDFFVVMKDNEYFVIKDKLQKELLCNRFIEVKFQEEKNFLFIKFNENQLESIIDLNESCYIKYSSNNKNILSGTKVYNLKKEVIFNLDILNKKIIYNDIEISTKEFKINKNEYFIYDFFVNKCEEFELVNVSIRTKKNSEKKIAFKIIDGKIIKEDSLINLGDKIITINNKIYRFERDNFYYYHESEEVDNNYKFDLKNLKLKTKKGFEEFLSLITADFSTYNYNYYASNILNKLSENKLSDKIFVKKMKDNTNGYFIFSEYYNQCLIFYPKKENKFFYFNAEKIFNVIKKDLVIIQESRSYYTTEFSNYKKKRINFISDINFLNKYLCITIEDAYIFESNGWRGIDKYEIKESNYYFDLRSNFIEYNIVNNDSKSVFNNSRITTKLLKKKDKTTFKINNLKLTLSKNSTFNEFKRKRDGGR